MEFLVKTATLIVGILVTIQGATEKDMMLFPQECSWKNSSFWYPATQQCETLYQEGAGDCGDKRWLVLDDNEVPRCADMPCSTHEYVKVGGTCRKIKDTDSCPTGMQVVVLDNGDGECDCRDGYVYYSRQDHATKKNVSECYELFQRGPCPARQVFSLRPNEHQARCRPNSDCAEGQVNVIINSEGQVRLPMIGLRGRCKQLNGLCFEDRNLRLQVNTTTNRLECAIVTLGYRVLIDAPLLNCTPGSRRDALGRCRRSIS